MTTPLRGWRWIAVAALAVLPAAAAGAAFGDSGSPGGAATTTTFRDAVGELGPDIETVIVSNDANGQLTFRIDIPNHPLITDDLLIRVWLDTDADSDSGLRGADRYLLLDRWGLGLGEVALFSCNRATCTGGKALPTSAGPRLRFAYASGATFTVEEADLGYFGPQRIVFWIEAWSGVGFDPVTQRYDLTGARADFAPDGAERRLGNPGVEGPDAWVHDSGTMFANRLTTQPAIPRAGRLFSLRLPVNSTDTGAPLTSGTVSCSARIGSKPLQATSSGLVDGRAVCTFTIPATAKGQSFTSTISVRSQGETLARTISDDVG